MPAEVCADRGRVACWRRVGTRMHSLLKAEPTASPIKATGPVWFCPKCGGPMVVVERLTAAQIQLRSPPPLLTA
jgi:hypothetical protein